MRQVTIPGGGDWLEDAQVMERGGQASNVTGPIHAYIVWIALFSNKEIKNS
jgi:hypothetical protein